MTILLPGTSAHYGLVHKSSYSEPTGFKQPFKSLFRIRGYFEGSQKAILI